MERSDSVTTPYSRWIHLFGTAFLYFLAGKFALLLAVPPGYASPIWPAAGFALACVLLFGNRVWPGIVIGHFLVNVGTSMDVSTADAAVRSILIPVGIGFGGAGQAMLGAYLIRRFVGWPNPLISEKETIRFFLLGGPVACLVSSTIGVGILIIAGIVVAGQIASNWSIWWLGDTLGALLAPPLLLVWLAQPRELWASRRKLLFLPLSGAMIASVILYLIVSHAEQSRIETEFKNSAILMSDAVKTNIYATVDAGDTVADFMQHSKDVTREEFRSFVTPLLARYPYIKAISWDPRVLDADRKKHEDKSKKEGYPQYGIKEKTADGHLAKAPPRADYIPVHYLEPVNGNEQALGYNLASEPKRMEALERAARTGQSAVSGKIRLVQDANGPHGVLLLHPVHGSGENGKTVKGFVTVVMYVDENIKAALKDVDLGDFKIELEDLSAVAGERMLARFDGVYWTDTAETQKAGTGPGPGISHHATFTMAGRTWAVSISPTAKYLDAHYSWPSWMSLAIGMLFCGLLSIFLLSVTGKSTVLEQTIRERTRDVTDLYNLAPCGYHSLDRNGVFIQINDTELQWLGYSRDEIIGKKKATDLMTEESREIFRRNFPKFLANGEIHDLEFEWTRRDGSIFNIILNAIAIRNEKGETVASRTTMFDITERKKAEKMVAESEARYRLLVDSSPFCIHEIGADGRLLSMNRAGLDMLGLKDEKEVHGKAYLDSVGRQDKERIGALLQQALEGTTSQFEFTSAGSEPRQFSSCFVPLRNAAGAVEKLMGITEDITERKAVEAELRESEERFKMLTEVAQEGVALSVNGIILDSNKQYAKLLGYDKVEDIKGIRIADMVAPESKEYVLGILKKNWDRPYEAVLVRKDGTRRIYEAFGHQTTYKGQKVRISTVIDITERKRVEQALRDHEFHLLQAQKVGGFGSFIYSIKEDRWISSEMLDEIFGIGADFDRSAAGWAGLIHPGDREAMQKDLLACIEGKKNFDREYRIIRPADGSERWLHGLGVLEYGADGHPSRIVGTNTDITARKKAEDAMRAAKEEAEAATLLKDKYVSLVSHDLKNPLGTIIGFLNLIHDDLERKGDQHTTLLTDAALISAGQMQILINEVLSISRIKSGVIQPKPKFFDGSMLGVKAALYLGPEAGKKGVALVNAIPEGTRLFADETLLGEVVNNLVSNGVKFCRSGDTITMFVPDNEPSTIAVKDTGVGIRRDLIPKLFMYEEKTSTIGTAGERGSGLGLPLSRDIMTTLGGSLDVESEQGKGSTFYARLRHISPKVLIVDDERNSRALLERYLEGLGVTVLEAEDGKQALKVIEESAPHLLVVDIIMPGMDGFELLEEVRKNPAASSTPVIMIAGQRSIEVNEKSLRLGADDFISKPISKEEFIPRVRRFIG